MFFTNRIKEYPFKVFEKYLTKFIVKITSLEKELVFYKSLISERWWMELPSNNNYEQNIVMACSYEDYLNGSKDVIPERWWRFYKKINC